MKNNSIANILPALAVSMLLFACKQDKQQQSHTHGHDSAAHSYKADTSIAYLLKPVNEQVVAQIPAIRPQQLDKPVTREIQGVAVYDARSETGIASRVAGRIEKLYIKYNYQPVRKGQVIMQIYSPDLVAAQREMLFIAGNNDQPALLNAAKQRLLFLGMTPGQLDQVLRSGRPVYSVAVYSNAGGYIIDKAAKAAAPAAASAAPAAGNAMGDGMSATPAVSPAAPPAPPNTPVMLREGQYVRAGEDLFTVYKADKLVGEFAVAPAIAAGIRKGQAITLQSLADSTTTIAATIGLVQPTFRNGENFMLVRVYLDDQPFKAGTLLKADVHAGRATGWWLPEAAVLQLGNRDVVFRKEGRVYKPVTIRAGARAGGYIQVPDSTAAWDIAANAYYLVDSESFIN